MMPFIIKKLILYVNYLIIILVMSEQPNPFSIENLIKKKQMYLRENAIRHYFLSKPLSPKYFCSYLDFAQVFPSPNIYEAYTSENFNIIDTHLRYHQHIFDKMMLYKWVPILAFGVATKFNFFSFIFPILYTNLFDSYFKKYFTWKHRNDKIINIRKEFITKLSKQKNKIRRVTLFDRLQQKLGITDQQLKDYGTQDVKIPQENELDNIPNKYIKFGESTQYIFHGTMEEHGIQFEQSHLYMTQLFQNYFALRNDLLGCIKSGLESLKNFKKNYQEFRQDYNENRQLYDKYLFVDLNEMIQYKDIKEHEVFSQTKKAEYRIRRVLELLKYLTTGEFHMNGFTFSDWTHFYKHKDLMDPQKFNVETNKSDIGLYYAVLAIPKFFHFILKRKVSL